jgi:DNA-binding PadR family transcriptional regulator
MNKVRITVAVAEVLQVFLQEPGKARHGFELMKATGFPSGKLYPILARLAKAEWLSRQREAIDPAAAGRPVRYLYQINPECIETAHQELTQLAARLSPSATPVGWLAPREGQI